jgi:hypothetical protein
MHPGQQFSLNIDCSLFRVVFAQCSGACYEIINPELGVTIFDAIFSLLILYILSDIQTSQFHLELDIREYSFSRASDTSLNISIQ